MKHSHLLLSPFGADDNGIAVEKCHNLRPTFCSDGAALRPASVPLVQYSDGWLPLTAVPQSDGSEVILLHRQNTLAVFSRGQAVATFVLDGPPISALPLPGRARVFTASGAYSLDVTSTSITGTPFQAPPMPHAMATLTNAVISAPIGSFTLQKSYQLGLQASASDRRTLSDAALSAYCDLDKAARAQGLWWQPAIIQTVLRDSAGNVIMRSAPQLMMHPDGLQFDGTVTLQSADYQTTAEAIVDAPAWRAVLLIPREAESLWTDAASLQVLASPTLHIADVSKPCTVAMRRRSESEPFATITPARSVAAAWPGAADSNCRTLADVVARFESIATPILTITNPAALAGSAIDLPPAPVSDVAADNKAITRAIKAAPKYFTRHQAWLSSPHTISPRLVASAGDLTLMADLAVKPFAGHPVEHFAIERTNKPWQAIAAVTFADGSRAVTFSEGNTNAPVTFAPLISYPSPTAVKIDFSVKTDTDIFYGSFPLQADASGSRAIYIAPGMRPFALSTATDFVAPDDTRAAISLPTHMLVASRSEPASVIASAQVPDEHFTALAPAFFGQNAWEFGRGRFFLMGAGGIYSVCLNSSRRNLAVSQIDTRMVSSPAAITSLDGTPAAVTTGRDIITFVGNKVKTIAKDIAATGLAYDSSRGELWCAPDDGPTTVICRNFGDLRYTVALTAIGSRTVHLPQGEWLCSDADARRMGRYEPIADTEILWQASVTVCPPIHRMAQLSIAASAKAVDLEASLYPALLSAVAPHPLWQRRFQGRIGADISARFLNARALRYVMRIAGAVSHDFTFSSFNVLP